MHNLKNHISETGTDKGKLRPLSQYIILIEYLFFKYDVSFTGIGNIMTSCCLAN